MIFLTLPYSDTQQQKTFRMLGTLYRMPTFTENHKFDSTNWIAFKNMVIIAAKVWGAIGYLKGIIKDPSTLRKSANTTNSKTTSTTTTKPKDYTINAISWNSNEPTVNK